MYSWREFGREAEFLVASYLKTRGWNIRFSPLSRGAADIVAHKNGETWCIQVKASLKSPHIKSKEIRELKEYACSVRGLPVLALVQPWQNENGGVSIGQYMIFLRSASNWELMQT
ncbi:MAG: hypothetical protein QXU32_09585 [Nitrososphaerales archaeon]